MATFKATVQKKRTDNTYLVYIRVTHNRQIEYIKTDMYITEKKIKEIQEEGKKKKSKEIADQTVLGRCAVMISEYIKKLNFEDIENWGVKEVVEFLQSDNTKISFSAYCKSFIDKMVNEGREKSASNYKCAYKSFFDFFGEKINFTDLNSNEIRNWIKSLSNMKRAKETYPKHIKAMFDAGCLEYNNYDRNIIKIPNRPFMGVKIPKHDLPRKKAIEPTDIKKVLEYKTTTKQTEKAQEVGKLIFYLVGINTVDLFNLKHEDYVDGKICYGRSKTKDARQDNAYIEIKVHPDIKYLFEKYKGEERLFDFGYKSDRVFNKHVNIGLRAIASQLNLPPVRTYTFRHSWATIARKYCGYSLSDIAICLNHRTSHRVTELYVDDDFKFITKVNNDVIDFVFGKEGKRERKKKISKTAELIKDVC